MKIKRITEEFSDCLGDYFDYGKVKSELYVDGTGKFMLHCEVEIDARDIERHFDGDVVADSIFEEFDDAVLQAIDFFNESIEESEEVDIRLSKDDIKRDVCNFTFMNISCNRGNGLDEPSYEEFVDYGGTLYIGAYININKVDTEVIG